MKKKRKMKLFLVIIILSILFVFGCEASPQSVKILEETPVENTVEFETNNIFLRPTQLEGFQQYAESENEQLLKDLSPMDIFKYYYHAFETQDYETLYGFYIKGEVYGTPNKKEFLNNKEDRKIMQLVFLHKLKDNIKSLAQIKYDENTTYIQVTFKVENELTKNQPWNFKLIKNSENIWKIDWIPREAQ